MLCEWIHGAPSRGGRFFRSGLDLAKLELCPALAKHRFAPPGLHGRLPAPMLRRMFDFLRPRWKKEARHLVKGAKKYLHYKRDLLDDAKIAEIESRREDLKNSLKSGDKKAVDEAGKQLRATCEKALPRAPQQTWWEENVEVMFVALVIALGLRAYVLQPFRIPTGSMQPTLNGIVIVDKGEDFEPPWFGARVFQWLWSGTSYKNIIADKDKRAVGLRDASWFLFTRTKVLFDDGSELKVPAATGEVSGQFFVDVDGDRIPDEGKSYRKGDPILRGTITTGDLVLVDKISYHFRKPRRGEVFVFDTRGLNTHGQTAGNLGGQSGGSHYIKRLCGVPGDKLQIDQPHLYVNGQIADEPGIARVANREGLYAADPDGTPRKGYHVASPDQRSKYPGGPLFERDDVFELKDTDRVGMREYAALGDNTANSLDSRYWGAVHEFNLAGPGWFSLWPFGSGHWGFID